MDEYWDVIGPTIPEDSTEQYTSFKIAERAIAGRRNLKILDLGCGDGRAVDFFRKLRLDVEYVGVDIESSPEVSTRTRADARFDTFDGINLPYDDEQFDIVFSHQVFEHVAEPQALLSQVRRVLKPGGLFTGSVSQLEPYHSLSLWNFTLYGWYKLLEKAGICVKEFRPGIDGITLIYRSIDGRKERFSKFFSSDSPMNKRIERQGFSRGVSAKRIVHRKVAYSGHLVFLAQKV